MSNTSTLYFFHHDIFLDQFFWKHTTPNIKTYLIKHIFKMTIPTIIMFSKLMKWTCLIYGLLNWKYIEIYCFFYIKKYIRLCFSEELKKVVHDNVGDKAWFLHFLSKQLHLWHLDMKRSELLDCFVRFTLFQNIGDILLELCSILDPKYTEA